MLIEERSGPSPSDVPDRSPPPVRVGVVGGGAWARDVHMPMHRRVGAGGAMPTELAAVWVRSAERRAQLAVAGLPVVDSFDALLEASEVVDFAVPPAVQARLAPEAARAGRGVMLEKPLAVDLEQARAVVTAIEAAGVPSTLFLTRRFHPLVREALAEAPTRGAPAGVVGVQAHGGFLPGGFLTEPSPWRDELGALMDLGPHLLDLGEQLAGPIARVRVADHDGWTTVDAEHASGALGRYAVSGEVATPRSIMRVTGYGPGGVTDVDTGGADMQSAADRLREEIAAAVRSGAAVTVDARRGLELAALLDACRAALASGAATDVAQRR